MNKITITGRLTRDVEMAVVGDGIEQGRFSVAVDRRGKKGSEKKTDFFNCTAWRQTADFIGKYFHKGQMAIVTGRLQNREWEDKDGNKRTTAEILVDHAYFCEKKQQFEELPDDEEIPF